MLQVALPPAVVAVTVALPVPEAPAVALNLAVLCPDNTVTEDGTERRDELELLSVTVTFEVAVSLMVTVTSDWSPWRRLDGLGDRFVG